LSDKTKTHWAGLGLEYRPSDRVGLTKGRSALFDRPGAPVCKAHSGVRMAMITAQTSTSSEVAACAVSRPAAYPLPRISFDQLYAASATPSPRKERQCFIAYSHVSARRTADDVLLIMCSAVKFLRSRCIIIASFQSSHRQQKLPTIAKHDWSEGRFSMSAR